MLTLACSTLALFFAKNVAAEGTWTSVPITGPEFMTDSGSGSFPWHYAEVYIGKPPQNQSLLVNPWSTQTFLWGPDCLFCPGDRVYDPYISQQFNFTEAPWIANSRELRGAMAIDTVNFGGIMETNDARLGIVQYISSDLITRFNEGHLGLFVHPTNQTSNQNSVIHQIWSSGQMKHPVIGLALKGDRPRLSIGALDPSDYDGEINWIEAQAVTSGTNSRSVIPIDFLRGHEGNIVTNVTQGTLAMMDVLSKNIYIPPAAYVEYFLNETLVGPQEFVNLYPSGGISIPCNYTRRNMNISSAYAPFSIDINGVNYPIDKGDMIRPQSGMSTNRTCNTALQNSTIADPTPITLGVSFLRSVYLAYRFPTPECPKTFYGFAYPKGAQGRNLSQKPRSSPPDSAQCLLGEIAATKPSTTPTPTSSLSFPVRTLDNNVRDPFPGERTFKVYGRPNQPEVVLRDTEGVPFVEERQAGDDDGRGGFFA